MKETESTGCSNCGNNGKWETITSCLVCNGLSKWRPKESEENKVESVIKFNTLWSKFIHRALVVNCQTKKEAKKFLKYCEGKGLTWIGGDKPTCYTNWHYYREKTCYTSYINFADEEHHKSNGYKVVTYSEMFGEEKGMYSLLNVMMKLKTHEVIKFVRISDGLILSADDEGNLTWESGHKKFNFNDKFKKVQEPVSFMEAVKAYAEGEAIRCETKNHKYIYDGSKCTVGMQDQNGNSLGSTEILEGKWFVEGNK